MGCAVSKQDEGDDVVSVCRERKKLLKLAAERRYAFADAQFKYNQSLYAVAMALRLFVARHSSPSSPFLITFPSTSTTASNGDNRETVIINSMFLQQRPAESTHESISCQASDLKVSLASSKLDTQEQQTHEGNNHDIEEESEEEESESENENGNGERICEHFYDDVVGPSMPSSKIEFGWDFFNPFDNEMRTELVNGFSHGSEEELRAVREKEGIPELEEDGESVVSETEVSLGNGDVGPEENGVTDVRSGNDTNNNVGLEDSKNKGLTVIDSPANGRELLEALKDIEDHFLRAYYSGLDISRMLEANRVQLQSSLEEIKESSNKLIRSITWNRSTSSRSSSCKSLITSSSMNSSMWTESKNDLFDDYRMEAGCHSTTLVRLYAWEKKLFEEVKAGEEARKLYEQKCSRLRHQELDTIGDGLCSMGKSRAEVKDLHARMSVAIRRAESISEKIHKLRDEELQPQLLELLHGLMRNWKIMLESHETQKRVMLEVKSFNCPAYGKFSNDSHRLATLQLEAELDNWNSCFAAYISEQKAYAEALSGWLSKFIAPEVEFYSIGKSSLPSYRMDGPPLLVTCYNWLTYLEKLPYNAVTCAIKSLGKDVHALQSQQGEEQQQKRKVDRLAKELDRRALAFQRLERRILESKISERGSEINMHNQIEYLAERKNQLDMFRKKLEAEKQSHLTSMQETHQITINGFQMGFSSVFALMAKFSKASVEMYAGLVTYSANAKTTDRTDCSPSDILGAGA